MAGAPPPNGLAAAGPPEQGVYFYDMHGGAGILTKVFETFSLLVDDDDASFLVFFLRFAAVSKYSVQPGTRPWTESRTKPFSSSSSSVLLGFPLSIYPVSATDSSAPVATSEAGNLLRVDVAPSP